MADEIPATPGARAGLRMGPAEWLTLIVLSLVWGASFFFAKVAVAEVPPLTIVLVRVAGAALCLWVVLRLTGRHLPRTLAGWAPYFLLGLINNVIPFGLIFWGQKEIASGLAAILNASTPLWTVLLAQLLTADEKIDAGKLAGIVLGIGGVAMMIGVDALHGLGDALLPQLAVVGAAVSYGFASIFGRRFSANPPIVTAAGQVTASTAMMLPIAAIVDRPWTLDMPSWHVIGSLVGLGIFSTAFAYILFFRIIARAGATNVSLVTLLVPVSAILLGSAVLGERLDPSDLAGMALIAAGLAAIDGRPFAMLRGRIS